MNTETKQGGATFKVLVWDVPTRVFHWLLVLSFMGAFVTSESEKWRLVHVTLGYTAGGLVAFRALWGFTGSRYARFASFLFSPSRVLAYLRSLRSATPEHHIGHNPAGGLAILLMLLALVVIVGSGYATYNEIGGHWLEETHEVLGNAMLLLVLVHVAGVVLSSRLHGENLVVAMLTGRKRAHEADGIGRSHAVLGVLLLLAVLGFWGWSANTAPTAAQGESASTGIASGFLQMPAGATGKQERHGKHEKREKHDD